MPTPAENKILQDARKQEKEAERKAKHQVQDLRKLNKNVDPDEEAESTEENIDPVTEAALEQNEAEREQVEEAQGEEEKPAKATRGSKAKEA